MTEIGIPKPMTVRIRKIHDVFLVDVGNVHFSGTVEELQQLANELQAAINQAPGERKE
jgi:hypothetical protein